MIKPSQDSFLELKLIISRERKAVDEMQSLLNELQGSDADPAAINPHIKSLEAALKKDNDRLPHVLDSIVLKKTLDNKSNEKKVQQVSEKKDDKKVKKKKISVSKKTAKQLDITKLERDILKRLNESNEKEISHKKIKPSSYVGISSKYFSKISRKFMDKKLFDNMIKDLLKTNIRIIPTGYVSVMFFTTFIALCVSFLFYLFFTFLKVGLVPPSISIAQNIPMRLLIHLWILILFPLSTFIFMYFYPSLEKKSIENSINQELPFATINMSAIAGSMIDPTNIFTIIIATGEYPFLKKEFTKVINEINIYGRDLVAALRSSANSSPSKKLTELYNGLATTTTSGGDLANFLDKRAESLLLDYRLERERYTKTAETFIDIYISVVIATPMILMLLLMMMQISGLGVSLSTSTISLMIILGVSVINFVFLMFLHLRQPTQ